MLRRTITLSHSDCPHSNDSGCQNRSPGPHKLPTHCRTPCHHSRQRGSSPDHGCTDRTAPCSSRLTAPGPPGQHTGCHSPAQMRMSGGRMLLKSNVIHMHCHNPGHTHPWPDTSPGPHRRASQWGHRRHRSSTCHYTPLR